MEDLVIESIQIYGADALYLPKEPLSSVDNVYGEHQGSIFTAAYPIELYLQDVIQRGGGGGELFAKFGLEIKDPYKFILARRTFQRYVPNLSRPREGDLIFVPQLSNMYEVTFVEEEKDFHSLGRRPPMFYYYEIQTQLFKFNNERFRTGNLDVDQFGRDYSYTIRLNMSANGSGIFIQSEVVYQGSNVANSNVTAVVKNWDRTNYNLDIINIKGIFANGVVTKGNTSNATWTTSDSDRRDFDQVLEEFVNNDELRDEADSIIQFNVENPFGVPNG